MICDFGSSIFSGDLIIGMPEFPFSDLPTPPADLLETSTILGESGGEEMSITGNVDD